MRKLIQIILLTCLSASIQAQRINTLFKMDTTGPGIFQWYGEMFIKATSIDKNAAGIIGGKGGFILNNKIALGGVGSGYLVKSPFIGDNLAGNPADELELRMATGGVYFEYIHQMQSAVHLSFPLSFTIGNLEVNALNGKRIESSRVLVIEPGFNIEFNFTKFLIIAVTGGYRISRVTGLTNLSSSDVSGPVVGLVGKFANF